MFTSEFRHTRHDHADLATSASLTADSAFSYSSSSKTVFSVRSKHMQKKCSSVRQRVLTIMALELGSKLEADKKNYFEKDELYFLG
jgi:hypothetical protein